MPLNIQTILHIGPVLGILVTITIPVISIMSVYAMMGAKGIGAGVGVALTACFTT